MRLFSRLRPAATRSKRQTRPVASKPELLELEKRIVLDGGDWGGISTMVIDGSQAPNRPEVVLVRNQHPTPESPTGTYGSGTLIDRQFVLTAAHVVDQNGDFHWNPADDGPLTVTISQNADVRSGGAQTYQVIGVFVHPLYYQKFVNGKVVSFHNDIAVLQLDRIVNNVVPATMATTPPQEREVVEVLGFGRTGNRSTGLEQSNGAVRYRGLVRLDKVSNETLYSENKEKGESGTAKGDSGGPTFAVSGNVRRLVGVHSYGSLPAAKYEAAAWDMRVDVFVSWINSIVTTAITGPSATVLRRENITTPTLSGSLLQVQYTDANGISESNVKSPHIALVGPNNYYNEYPDIGLVTRSADGIKLTVDYSFRGPGGTWGARDNGQYRVVLLNNGLKDNLGNPVGTGQLTTLSVGLPADSRAPTATLNSNSEIAAGATNLIAQVSYSDDSGLDARSLGNNDVYLVKEGGGYTAPGRLMISNTVLNNTGLSMPYEFAPPGGTWGSEDNGKYNLIVEGGSVSDLAGKSVGRTTIGSITVSIAGGAPLPPRATLNVQDITSPTSSFTFSITYTDDVAVSYSSVQNSASAIIVDGSNFVGDTPTLVSLSTGGNATSITATYRVNTTIASGHNGRFFRVYLYSGSFFGGVTDTSGNYCLSGPLGGLAVKLSSGGIDSSKPIAQMSADDVTLTGEQTQWFDVVFSDDQAVAATSITDASLFIVGPDGQQYPLVLAGVNYGQDDKLVSATFGWMPPEGGWTPSQNGYYRIAARDGTISDTFGNYLLGFDDSVPLGGELGAFEVAVQELEALPTIEVQSQIPALTDASPTYTFTITYSSSEAIDVSTLGDENVYVTNEGGFSAFAKFVSVDPPGDGISRTATYSIEGPNGAWTKGDNGDFQVFLAGAILTPVATVNGTTVTPAQIGVLHVAIVDKVAQLNVIGNETAITNDDLFPDAADGTEFGGVRPDGGTVSRSFRISNTGTASLSLTGTPVIQIAGSHAADFSVTQLPAASVGIGSETTFTIRFQPSEAGVRAALVTILSNDPEGSPFTFAIQGTGDTSLDVGDTLSTALDTGIGALGGYFQIQEGIGNITVVADDIDMFRITSAGNSFLSVRTAPLFFGNVVDTYLRVFNSAGLELANDDDSGGWPFSMISSWFLPTAGDYFIGVSAHPNVNYNPAVGVFGMTGPLDSIRFGPYFLEMNLTPAPVFLTFSTPLPETVIGGKDNSVTLTVQDALGNPYPGFTGTISFSSTDINAKLPADFTFGPADGGTHTFTMSFATSGAHTLSAILSENSASGISSDFNVLVLSQILPVNFVADIYGPGPSNSQTEAYIKGLYRLILGRNSDPAGLAGWVQKLLNGLDRTQIVHSFWNSPENRGREVDAYYQAYLGRLAEKQGRDYWIQALQSGADETAIVFSFLLSPESNGAPTGQFIDRLYQGALGRKPDAGGRAGWVADLDAGFITREQVANSFVLSEEAVGAAIDSFYINYLRRIPDAGGRASWLGSIIRQESTFATVAELILSSDEFFDNAAL